MDYWHETWGVGGRFEGVWDHSSNFGSRTTNHVEEFHSTLRRKFPARSPSIPQILEFLQAQLSLAKSRVQPIAERRVEPRYIRPAEAQMQREVYQELLRFHEQILTNLPTTRECKNYLDFLAYRLAH
ncbi:hypothetical protein Aduo_001968 [Ancylostoma duodenale]